MAVIRLLLALAVILSGLSYAWAEISLDTTNSTQNDTRQSTSTPDPLTLQANWWKYFDVPADQLKQHIDQFLEVLHNPPTYPSGPSLSNEQRGYVKSIEQTLSALLMASTPVSGSSPETSTLQDSYTAADIKQLLDRYQKQILLTQQRRGIYETESKAALSAKDKAEQLYVRYRDAASLSEQKYQLGLQLIYNRLTWLVWEKRKPALTSEIEGHEKEQVQTLELLQTAVKRFHPEHRVIDALYDQVISIQKRLEKADDELITARSRYTQTVGLDFRDVVLSSLYRQQVILAEIRKQTQQVSMASAQAFHTLALLGFEQRDDLKGDFLEEAVKHSQLLRTTPADIQAWREQVNTERKNLQSDLQASKELEDSSETRRIINQRLEILQTSLEELSSLEQEIKTLHLLTDLVHVRMTPFDSVWFQLKSQGISIIGQVFGGLWNVLNKRLFSLGDAPVTSWNIIIALLVIFLAFFLASLARRSILRWNRTDGGKIPPGAYTLSRIIYYVLLVLGVFVAFSVMGVNFTNLAIVAGALSVGIGFGLQSIVNNFVSGIIILFEQNIKVGDFIELDTGMKGIVRDINVRSTVVNTLDNLDIIVPNSELVAAKVTNYTLNEPMVRIHIPFGVAYGSDKELVSKAGLEAARKVDITYDDGANRRTQVWLVGFGDSSLDFELVVWVNPKLGKAAPGSWRALYTWEIETALRQNGIEIPFPQRDLHLRSGFSLNSTS